MAGRRETYIIKVALDNVDVAGECLEIVIRLLGAQVARAENVLDLSRHLHACHRRKEVNDFGV